MIIAAAVRSLSIPRFVAVMESLLSDGAIAVAFGLSVAASCFQEANARRKRPLIGLVRFAPGLLVLHLDLASD